MVWLGKSHFCDLITQKIPVAMQQPKIVLYVRLNELKSIKLKNCWSWIYCSLFHSDQINSSEDIQILLSDNQLISDSPLLTMKNMKAKGWTYGKQQKHDFVHMNISLSPISFARYAVCNFCFHERLQPSQCFISLAQFSNSRLK